MRVTTVAVAVFVIAGVCAAQSAVAAPGYTPLNAEMVPAMEHDLGLSHQQAIAQFAASARAGKQERSLSDELGKGFGGAVFDPASGGLEVGVTDPAMLDLARRPGVAAKLVRFNASELNSTVDTLNARGNSAPDAITGWGVDTPSNRVKVTVRPGGEAAAARFLAASGVGDTAVVAVASAPRPLYDVRGGDAYYIANRARCSVGFSVVGGFLSAGHCAAIGSSIAGYNRVEMGSFSTYRFPGQDYSLAKVNSQWTPRGVTNNRVRVSGSAAASVGAVVCKAGSTSGWTCGFIMAKNQTVRYAEGPVYGMIETNLYAAAGDSGGPLLAGNQAEGLLSGGDGVRTYFFPVQTALSATGARLITS